MVDYKSLYVKWNSICYRDDNKKFIERKSFNKFNFRELQNLNQNKPIKNIFIIIILSRFH